MNLCSNGYCICGGWTDDFGWHPCDESERDPVAEYKAANADLIQRYYFWSDQHRVILSVDHRTGKDERLPGVDYYRTPEEAAKSARDDTVRVAYDAGLVDEDDARRLFELNPVMDPSPPTLPPKPGPRGQRRRVFPIKSKPGQ